MSDGTAINRRDFIKTSAASALMLGFYLPQAARSQMAAAPAIASGFKPNAWISIDATGAVAILISKTEMGQGTATGMAMILADELDADWSRVSVRTIQPDGKRFMITGASFSIAGAWRAGRPAAAAAREMLHAAGATALGVDVGACVTRNHAVIHTASGRQIDYRELVGRAAALKLPDKPQLKDPNTYKIVGQPLAAKNLQSILSATGVYGADVKVPGMLYAAIERCPVINGRIARVGSRAALAHAGVSHVVRLRGNTFPTYNYIRDGVAVVANSTWAALAARRKLQVNWHEAWTDARGQNGLLASSSELT
ncbi:MAG: molybdopterin cofactor-binding domain-containing protein, partial [Burkholderiaceae bacterium]